MIRLALGVAGGIIGHLVLYDTSYHLPHPPLVQRAAGVFIAWPVIALLLGRERAREFVCAYFGAFAAVGMGCAVGRWLRVRG